MLLPAMFDATRTLIVARHTTIFDHDVGPGQRVEARKIGDEQNNATRDDSGTIHVDHELALRLWMALYLVYDKDFRPTPSETHADEASRVVQMEELGGGWFLITAPWPSEAVKIHGRDEAEAERKRIADKGDTKGVTVEQHGSWFHIIVPWLDEPVKVQGAEAAAVEEQMLIEDGPPEGWTPETPEAKAERIKAAADAADARERADREAEKAEAERQRQAERDEQNHPIQAVAAGGGWWTISGVGLAEPIKVKGRDEAQARLAEVRAEAAAAADASSTTDANGVNTANPASEQLTSDTDGVETRVTGATDGASEPPTDTHGELESVTGSEEPPAPPQDENQGNAATDTAPDREA